METEQKLLLETQAWLAKGADPKQLFTRAGPLRAPFSRSMLGYHGTRLYFAAANGFCDVMRLLLAHGADPNIGDPTCNLHCKWTPLHVAAINNHRDAVAVLLDAGARVEDRTNRERTVLHYASIRGHVDVIRLLLSRGAALDARDKNGNDCEAYARDRNEVEAADLLAAVRGAGGWGAYVRAPRVKLLALRQALPALRADGRATAPDVPVHERLFAAESLPKEVFWHVTAYWRCDV